MNVPERWARQDRPTMAHHAAGADIESCTVPTHCRLLFTLSKPCRNPASKQEILKPQETGFQNRIIQVRALTWSWNKPFSGYFYWIKASCLQVAGFLVRSKVEASEITPTDTTIQITWSRQFKPNSQIPSLASTYQLSYHAVYQQQYRHQLWISDYRWLLYPERFQLPGICTDTAHCPRMRDVW